MMLLRQVRWFGANGRRALEALQKAPGCLTEQFSRASGPGGQHVNKVNTRAELRLDLDRATDTAALPRDVADRKAALKAFLAAAAAQTGTAIAVVDKRQALSGTNDFAKNVQRAVAIGAWGVTVGRCRPWLPGDTDVRRRAGGWPRLRVPRILYLPTDLLVASEDDMMMCRNS